MSTPTENQNVPDNPNFEPFPETQTIPSGWDFSGLTTVPEHPPASPEDDQVDNSTP